jgi:type IV pilus assembly protein PilB
MSDAQSPSVHRFVDEWLLALVRKLPDAPLAPIEEWRQQRRPYLSQALLDAGILSFDMLAGLIRNAYRIESVEPQAGVPNRAILELVPDRVRRRHRVVPMTIDQKSVSLAMANPLDSYATQDVESATGRRVVPLFCPPGHLHKLELELLDPDEVVYDLVRKFETQDSVEVLERDAADAEHEDPGSGRAPVIKLVNGIITQAVRLGASDVHIEHEETSSLVRYRIDGSLRNVMVLPRYVAAGPVVARIKIMAGLDVTVHFRPQDGRAKLRIGKDDVVGLRVSTLPSQHGEKVVLRILNEKAIDVTLERLGFEPATLASLNRSLTRAEGMLLVTGPTGSGKTTTLYAALRALATEKVNVVTIEDPVEYRLPHITQVQVNEAQGLTFAGVLRSVLRQDPDVILIGELRDEETATVGVQAALTGHLVLATLHTNDAVGAVVRLGDLGVEGFKLAAALLGVTAQRLVRKLCDGCARDLPVAELPAPLRHALEQAGTAVRPRGPVGCATCGFTGYRGRLPLIEYLEITDTVRSAIAEGASADRIRELALAGGALRLLELDALRHLSLGSTSLDQCAPYLRLGAGAPDGAAPDGVAAAADGAAPDGAAAAADAVTPAAADGESDGAWYAAADAASAPTTAPTPVVLQVLLAMADATLDATTTAALAAAGHTVERLEDGAAVLGRVAQQAPDVLVVGPGLRSLNAAQTVRALRAVMGYVDLPVVVIGTDVGDDVVVSDTLVPPLDAALLAHRVEAAAQRRSAWADTAAVALPPVPPDEADRLRALHDAGVLDTPAEDRFDRITRAAQERFGVPVALISLIDEERQWFKSRLGMAAPETARADSFCGHAINHDDAFVVPDASLDLRFAENALVTQDPHIRFYAGQPIRSPDGHRVGMLCIMDRRPRDLTVEDTAALAELRDEVERELWPAAR